MIRPPSSTKRRRIDQDLARRPRKVQHAPALDEPRHHRERDRGRQLARAGEPEVVEHPDQRRLHQRAAEPQPAQHRPEVLAIEPRDRPSVAAQRAGQLRDGLAPIRHPSPETRQRAGVEPPAERRHQVAPAVADPP